MIAELDPARMTAEDADAALTELVALSQLAHAGCALLAGRALESGRWKERGERSKAHHLARRMGTSLAAATRLIETSAHVSELPGVESELRSGSLSPAKADVLADAAHSAPGQERELIGAARRESLFGLRSLRDKIAAAADKRSDEERQRDAHAGRSLSWRSGADSTFELTWRNTTSAGAELVALLQPLTDAQFEAARSERSKAVAAGEPEPDHEPAEALRADALLAALRASAGSAADATADHSDGRPAKHRPPKASRDIKVIVRIDHQALRRGHAEPGEICELEGIGPVPVSAVRELMDDAFIAAILTDGTDIRRVVHLGRHPNALQRTALQWRDPTCAIRGCDNTIRLEYDHTTEWARTRHTTFDELARLCGHHHDLKSDQGYLLVRNPDGTYSLHGPPARPDGRHRDPRGPTRRSRRGRTQRVREKQGNHDPPGS